MAMLKTCCFCCSTRIGSLISGIFSLVVNLVASILIIATLTLWPRIKDDIEKKGVDALDVNVLMVILCILLAVAVIGVIVGSFLIHGIRKERRLMLLPWIVFHIVGITATLICIIFIMIQEVLPLTCSIPWLITTLLCIYVTAVVLSHYQELLEDGRLMISCQQIKQ